MGIAPNIRNGDNPTTAPQIWSVTDPNGEESSFIVVVNRFDSPKPWNGVVWQINHSARTRLAYDLDTIAGNPLRMPVKSADAHHRLTDMVDSLGYIWLTGNRHDKGNEPWQGERVVRSVSPWTIADGFIDATPYVNWSTSGLHLRSYDRFLDLGNGKRGWITAQHIQTAVIGRGMVFYVLEAGETMWQPFDGVGTLLTCDTIANNGDPERAYIFAHYVAPDNTLYLVCCWQYVWNDATTRREPFVIKSTDHVNFTTLSGTPLPVPMTRANTVGIPDLYVTNPIANVTLMGMPTVVDGVFHVVLSGGGSIRHHWFNGVWNFGSASAQRNFFTFRGELWYYAQSFNKVRFRRNTNTGIQYTVSGTVPSGTYRPYPDPVRQKRGIVALPTIEGDIPSVAFLGAGSARRAVAA